MHMAAGISTCDTRRLFTKHLWSFALLTAVLLGAPVPCPGQSVDPAVENEILARAYTQNVVVAASAYQKAAPTGRPSQLRRLQMTAQRRLDYMIRLAQLKPKKFLALVLPSELRKSVPTAVQNDFEQEAEAEGILQVFHVDYRTTSYYEYVLRSPHGDLSIQFAENAPPLQTGSRIRVKGYKVRHVLAVGSGSSDVQPLALAAPLVSGGKTTAVIMVNFSDKSNTYSQAQIRDVVFTQTSNFHKENSYQQAWLTGDVFGPFTIPMASTVCDYSGLGSQARSAMAGAGGNLSAYKHFVYIFPQNACGWWGLGTIGGNPAHAWINGSVAYRVVAHEMGHNFGLYHSHALECGNATLAPACQNIEYGDTIDVMGMAEGHLNAFQKERLGWLNGLGTPPITTAQNGGQYLIDAYEPSGSMPKAIKVLKGIDTAGKKSWYYVEYRQPIGFDGFLASNNNVKNGVVIHTGSEASADSSFLLDMTGGTTSWNDPALPLQQSFQDPQAGIGISVAWLTGTTAAVDVTTGTQTCVRAKPELVMAPVQGVATEAGKAASYTLSITNKDNSACTASSFSIAGVPPSGWAVTATSPVTINPGATINTAIQVTSPAGTGDGSYDIPLNVTNTADSAKSATALAKYVVASLCTRAVPTFTISPTQGTAVRSGTPVHYTLMVLNNDSTACAAAAFSLSNVKPPGFSFSYSATSLSIAPATSATAILTVTSGPRIAPGSYGFHVTAMHAANRKLADTESANYVVAISP